MLSNVRRKILQKNIKKYSELQINEWWDSDIITHIHKYSNFGNQRYSKNKMKQSFENSKIGVFIPYEIGNNIYNMIPCPSGSFIKGSNRENDNNPLEKMNIEKPFLLGETEITQELYKAIMESDPSEFKGNPKNPVEKVSWYDALIFCNKLSDSLGLEHYYTIGDAQEITDQNGKTTTHYSIKMNEDSKGFRLPTEWEWEYAAKADTQLKFSGSDYPNEVAWLYDKQGNNIGTHPVKQKKPNAWGFYDMSGNVDEWCENKYHPKSDHLVVIRGGSWDGGQHTIAYRWFGNPSNSDYSWGFRVCKYI